MSSPWFVVFCPTQCLTRPDSTLASRIIVASGVAIPTASLCINRRLYKIATLTTVNRISSSQVRLGRVRNRQFWAESDFVTEKTCSSGRCCSWSGNSSTASRDACVFLFFSTSVPPHVPFTEYIVSGHRYDVYGDIGCFPFTYNTLPAYPLVVIWPVVIGLISAVYCGEQLFRHGARTGCLTTNSSHSASFPSPARSVQSVPLLQCLPHRQSLLPADGSGDARAVLHHPHRPLGHVGQLKRLRVEAMDQLV